ncbi:hypothetical protein ELH22_08895 [Rhizobium ruizarguesonis]|uniref:hypothetical protein n=1 Tax=Rhizobium ruizarguesonis TaxID=2081791 RepID=UPI0010321419|nr:hypothetical protein [Rhizobium ruizarguesonis]TBD63442.1 hypothetical protein ELH22_08895 [Rhizobium ruizarguesonis]
MKEFKKNIDFLDIMFRMSYASTRLAFGAFLEQLPLEYPDEADNDVEEGRVRLRTAILSQIKEFEILLALISKQ